MTERMNVSLLDTGQRAQVHIALGGAVRGNILERTHDMIMMIMNFNIDDTALVHTVMEEQRRCCSNKSE